MVDLNTLNSWNSSSRTDKIVYVHWLGGSSRFQVWLRKNCGTTDSNFHEKRKQSLEQELCYLIIIMHLFWSKTPILRGFVGLCSKASNLGQAAITKTRNVGTQERRNAAKHFVFLKKVLKSGTHFIFLKKILTHYTMFLKLLKPGTHFMTFLKITKTRNALHISSKII